MEIITKFFTQYSSELVTGVLTFVGSYIVFKLSQKRPDLLYYISSLSDFKVGSPNNEFSVYTHSITVTNRGKSSANDVQIKHRVPLTGIGINYKILPEIPYQIIGDTIIQLNCLHPKESVQISYLYFYPHTVDVFHEFVRSKECLAKPVPVTFTIVYPKWFNYLVVILMGLGILFILRIISYFLSKFAG